MGLSFITAIVLGFQVWLLLQQNKIIRQQNEIMTGQREAADTQSGYMRDGLTETRKAADAAKLGADISQDALHNTRAFMWLRTAALNLKVSSIRFYTDHLENHIFPELGSHAVSEIARKDCRTLITTCRGKGLKIGTVRGIVRTLSTVLSQAVEDDLLPANPALQMRRHLKRGDEPQAEPDPFTKDEVAHVLRVASQHFPQWHAWLLCGLRTGMRAGELLALQWNDIDWRGSFINLERNLVRGVITTPKNHQRRRVDMSRQLRANSCGCGEGQQYSLAEEELASSGVGVRVGYRDGTG